MIEIGREPGLTKASRRLGETFGGMSALLVLVWLVRGFIGLQSYSLYLLLGSFGFVFLSSMFHTQTNRGPGRAVSSFLGKITGASIGIIILIWFLGWIAGLQGDVIPKTITDKTTDLVIVALATGLAAYAARKLSPSSMRPTASQPVFLLQAGGNNSLGATKLSMKADSAAIPIKQRGKTVGCVVKGDVTASFDTPMGTVNAFLAGPVTTAGIALHGRKLGGSEVQRLTGKSPSELVSEVKVDMGLDDSFHSFESVDLPFVHVREGLDEEEVEVGPIKVREGPHGSHVKIGPFSIDGDGKWDLKGRWLLKGGGGSYVRAGTNRVSAKWNGSRLTMDDDRMELAVGSDSFSYSPSEVKTKTPLHTLRVTQDKVTLDTSKFTLNISGDSVILRAEDKTRTTQSKALAADLRTLLAETAKKQVGEVMEGMPIDLNEMLTATEEMLGRHA